VTRRVAGFPKEGCRELARRARIVWLLVARLRLKHALYEAEAELGWLGWEQADYFDERIEAEVAKVREFEEKQAQLLNSSAKLSSRKAALDEELAREQNLHDQVQQALAGEREPHASQLERARASHRQKLGAIERFDRALEEIGRLEKHLEARSAAFLQIDNPDIEARIKAREVTDELSRTAGVRRFVLADKASASEDAQRLEPGVAQLRAELDRIDAAAAAARERLANAVSHHAVEVRLLERKRKKSESHMARLDDEKRNPYRRIGECLADQRIAPRNQPEILEKVLALRDREASLHHAIAGLHAASAAASPADLVTFYLLLVAALLLLCGGAWHLLHR